MCKRKQRVLLVVNPQKAFRGSTCALEELTTYVKGVFSWYDLVIVSCFSTSVYGNKNKLYTKKLGNCGLPRMFKAEELGYFLSEISGVVVLNSNQRGISLQELVDKDETDNFNGVLNARLSLRCKSIDIDFWAHNLTNHRYTTFYFESILMLVVFSGCTATYPYRFPALYICFSICLPIS